jgi:arginine decarboxylase
MTHEVPLLEALKGMKDTLPMHMPGHKRNRQWGPVSSVFAGSNVYDLDFTEVPGLDDLHAPEGVIDRAQKLAGECFHSRHTLFLVNGASVGVTAAVMSCCAEGDTVLVPRHGHRCIYEGLVFSGAYPVYYQPEFNSALTVPLSPNLGQIADLIDSTHPRALIMVHPTYHGVGCDLSIINEAARNGVITIVDEAHGSHFCFDDRLPMSALEAGADIVVHSTHKTLGSMTQTGLLHLGTDRLDPGHLANVLSLLQSTSPSYVLMASLDAMRADLAEGGRKAVGRTVDLALELRERIGEIKGFSAANPGGSWGYDLTKIMLRSSFMDGFTLGQNLRREYGIYPEMETHSFVLLMVTVGDSPYSIQRLLAALEDISSKSSVEMPHNSTPVYNGLPEVVLTPRQAFYFPKQKCNLWESIGKISGSLVVPYPPGVPLLCPGERISREIVEYLSFIKGNHIHVHGLGRDCQLTVLEC